MSEILFRVKEKLVDLGDLQMGATENRKGRLLSSQLWEHWLPLQLPSALLQGRHDAFNTSVSAEMTPAFVAHRGREKWFYSQRQKMLNPCSATVNCVTLITLRHSFFISNM